MDISKFEITEMPFGLRVKSIGPDIQIYNFLNEEGVRKMVNDHYDLLVESSIKEIFPPKGELLEGAKRRSADFFIQRLGGPQYYQISRGNPMLANRHLPFRIDPKTRIVWLNCYKEVLSRMEEVPEHLVLSFWVWLDEFSNWMVNQHDTPQFKMNIDIPRK